MKKNSMNNKGFAMAELLAISVAILLLLSILVSSFIPIVAEYENRTDYNNVTANYAAFYVRKIYKNRLENDNAVKTILDDELKSGFYRVYNPKKDINVPRLAGNLQGELTTIINNYQIEEIIITNYKVEDVKKEYTRSEGLLYDYIQYLPFYGRATYGSYENPESYRIILKTKEFGYATVQILPDPPTPIACFKLGDSPDGDGWMIEEYIPDKCEHDNKKNVVISPNIVRGNKRIVAIGKDAFNGDETKLKLDSVSMPKNVKTIGESAFANNNIKSFNLENNAPGVTSVGNYAFKNNAITKVVIPNSVSIGKGAFANNYGLKKIAFDFTDFNNHTIAEEMFKLDYTSDTSIAKKRRNIDLSIPGNVTSIGKSAFENLKLHTIKFESKSGEPSKLDSVGASAFSIDSGWVDEDNVDKNYLQIIIPENVRTIGNSAFENVKIKSLTFNTSQLQTIGSNAFSTLKTPNYDRNLVIPASVQTIGSKAFNNQNFKSITISQINSSKLTSIGDKAFNGNNDIQTFTFPKSISSGSDIFGHQNSSLGSEKNQLLVTDSGLLPNRQGLWCGILFGTSSGCTYEAEKVKVQVTERIPEGDPDYVPVEPGSTENPNIRIVEKEVETGVYICSYGGATRHISPVGGGGTNG